MARSINHARRSAVATVAVLGVLTLGACDFLRGVSEPEVARVEISSDDVNQVSLITSRYFLMVPNPECPDDPSCETVVQLVESDTVMVDLPFVQSFDFTPRLQIFVETAPPEGVGATLSMKVTIDGEPWYDNFRRLEPADQVGEQETLRFVYNFRQITVDDLVS